MLPGEKSLGGMVAQPLSSSQHLQDQAAEQLVEAL
jgi:hypothetical protein